MERGVKDKDQEREREREGQKRHNRQTRKLRETRANREMRHRGGKRHRHSQGGQPQAAVPAPPRPCPCLHCAVALIMAMCINPACWQPTHLRERPVAAAAVACNLWQGNRLPCCMQIRHASKQCQGKDVAAVADEAAVAVAAVCHQCGR